MKAIFKTLKYGALWGFLSAIFQLGFNTLNIAAVSTDISAILISALTFPSFASAIILRNLGEFFVEGLLNRTPTVIALHIFLSINIGVLIGLLAGLFLFFNKPGGKGDMHSEWVEMGGVSG